ncbi:MAG: hypothetical protein AAF291_13010 [Pseudomonadota bacterium]
MKATSSSFALLGAVAACALTAVACASAPPSPAPSGSDAAASVPAATPVAAASAASQPAPAPSPAPAPTRSAPAYENYLDAPQTPGTWAYLGERDETLALYGENPRAPVFMVRCGDGAVSLGRVMSEPQTNPRVMRVTAETGSRQLEAEPVEQRPIILAATLDPADPLLDAIAITKGRFAVDVEGAETLYLPAWVEVSRVIEDCR